MRISVRLAEPYWRAVGRKDLSLEIDAPSQVGDLLALFRRSYPRLGAEIDSAAPLVFVDEVVAEPGMPLHDGCCVYLVWPVAGG